MHTEKKRKKKKKKAMLSCDLGYGHLPLTVMPLNHAYGRKY